VYDGTTATQFTVQCTLAEVPARFKAVNKRAAVLVIGRVAGLREHLRWFDSRPLFGKRVLVTRPREQSAEFVALLESLGAQAIEAPMISIAPPADWGPLDEICQRVGEFDWIVFSSGHGVDYFFNRLLAGPLDLRALKNARLCAVGPSTAEHLTRLGLKVDLVPAESKAEAVVQAMNDTGTITGSRVLVPRADIGREVIAEGLRKRGADVTEVVAYRTVAVDPDRDGGPDVFRMLLEKGIDVVTFTSPSAVRNFVEVIGAEPAADLLKTTIVASIGPVTAEAATHFDIHSQVVPNQYTIKAMVDAIVRHFEGRV
jgi:uroporphyrinogen III methyltransferase/synthase